MCMGESKVGGQARVHAYNIIKLLYYRYEEIKYFQY